MFFSSYISTTKVKERIVSKTVQCWFKEAEFGIDNNYSVKYPGKENSLENSKLKEQNLYQKRQTI